MAREKDVIRPKADRHEKAAGVESESARATSGQAGITAPLGRFGVSDPTASRLYAGDVGRQRFNASHIMLSRFWEPPLPEICPSNAVARRHASALQSFSSF